jgi:hypothetical protein
MDIGITLDLFDKNLLDNYGLKLVERTPNKIHYVREEETRKVNFYMIAEDEVTVKIEYVYVDNVIVKLRSGDESIASFLGRELK